MKRALFLAAALALSACATGALIDAGTVRTDGVARIGQPTRVGALVVTPQTLVEDSRCPMNARCIWAGRAVVKTRIDGPGWRETTNLELGRRYVTHGLRLQLSSVRPDKMTGAQPAPADYVFGFEGGH